MTIFLIFTILFNLLNVRRYGEIEYWLTLSKVTAIMGLVVLGTIIAMGGHPGSVLLGTSLDYQPVDCSLNEIGDCLPGFGFVSITPLPYSLE